MTLWVTSPSVSLVTPDMTRLAMEAVLLAPYDWVDRLTRAVDLVEREHERLHRLETLGLLAGRDPAEVDAHCEKLSIYEELAQRYIDRARESVWN